MKRWQASLLAAAGAGALAFSLPAWSQREQGPETILPPGFGDPGNTAQPQPAPERPDAAPTPSPSPEPRPAQRPRAGEEQVTVENSALEDLEELSQLNLPPPIEIPEQSRRPTDVVGPLTEENGGLGAGAFGSTHGAFLTGLMSRMDAPIASRWASILLRRALLSRVPAPRGADEVDWVAERASLLVRMGEADAARALVQAIDVDRFTPRMFSVAVQTALATADPAALCPLVGPGRTAVDEPVWPLADAMCAALAGEAARASQLIDQARRRGGAGGVDLLLAEKVIGAGVNTRRAVTVQWEGVERLDAWRFGLASATGLDIPAELIAGAGPAMQAWLARAPMVPIEQRIAAADAAADLGVFSNAALVDIHSLLFEQADPSEAEGTIGARLRRAYVGRTVGERLDAMDGLWKEGDRGDARHARRILTAAAAARIPPAEEHAEHADDLIASMLAAGFDRIAAAWAPVVNSADEDRAWSLLAVAAPRPVVDVSSGRVESFVEADDSLGRHRGRMLAAALAGLGRLDDPGAHGVDIRRSRWSNLLASAAENGRPGTVAVLAAAGMQTGDWRGVPPGHLFHILRALRRVGLDYEARMIAAEALSRL